MTKPPLSTVGPTGRKQLEKALETGPAAFAEQVRYLIALAQVRKVPAQQMPYNPPALTLRQARLQALVQLANQLSEEQIDKLLEEVNEIELSAVRLSLLAKFASHLSSQRSETVVRDVWQEADSINNPAQQAATLFDVAPLMSISSDEPAASSSLMKVMKSAQSIKDQESRIRSLIALAPHLPYDISQRTYRQILTELENMTNDALCAKSLASLTEQLNEPLLERAVSVAEGIQNPAERAYAFTALAPLVTGDMEHQLRYNALEAIDSIEPEDERADALIKFVPHLDYAKENTRFPEILEKALTITIMIGRRHIRARVLVALASHLTSDLQGEALAAVHSLSSERERAMLLAGLAPTLPPDILVASLAVAHTMREQDARVHALTVMAHYAPASARTQTMLDALAAASNLTHHYERIRALVDLLDILPDNLIEQTLSNALDTVRLITNESAQARALSMLSGHLTEPMVERAMIIVSEMENPQQRINALVSCVEYLEDEALHAARFEMLGNAQQLPLEYKRARALISIAPHLTPDMLTEVTRIADRLDDPVDKASVYIAVAQNLPPNKRLPVIVKAWSTLQQIDAGYDRAHIIALLAPLLPDNAHADLAKLICDAVIAIQDEYDRASAIAILVPLLADSDYETFANLPDRYRALQRGLDAAFSVPNQSQRVELLSRGAKLWSETGDAERSYALWQHLAEQLMRLSLTDLLLSLGALSPIIQEFAGKEGLDAIAHLMGVR